MDSVVEMRGITKRFGPLVANDGIGLNVASGEVLALLGENGAGKSTLMKILYGLYQPDAGDIRVNGRPVALRSPADAIAHGIGMVTQHFALVPTLTVAENIALGHGRGMRFDRAAADAAARDTARRYGLDIHPAALVRDLSVGEQQRVEILKALHRQARVLILDEPTAVLTPQESRALFVGLKRLVAGGLAIIFISHKLDEVLSVADRVTVLRDGRVVGSTLAQSASASSLAEMMVGRATFGVRRHSEPGIVAGKTSNANLAEHLERSALGIDDVTNTDLRAASRELDGAGTLPSEQPIDFAQGALRAERLSQPAGLLALRNVHALNARGLPALRGVTFDVQAGEVLGIAGVSGNGQAELAEAITGMRRITHGDIVLDKRNIANLSAAQATSAGIGRIPEDRKVGAVSDLSVAENLALEHLGEFTRSGLLDRGKMRAYAGRLIAQYDIKASPDSRAGKLSGGNMQKVILARVLSRDPRLVVAAQPTRGLDVGASDYVRTKLIEQRDRGAAVLLISEDLDEILALSDRVAVMFEGRVMGIVDADDATAEQLGLMMAGSVLSPSAREMG